MKTKTRCPHCEKDIIIEYSKGYEPIGTVCNTLFLTENISIKKDREVGV